MLANGAQSVLFVSDGLILFGGHFEMKPQLSGEMIVRVQFSPFSPVAPHSMNIIWFFFVLLLSIFYTSLALTISRIGVDITVFYSIFMTP